MEFDELMRKAEESMEGGRGSSTTSDGRMLRGICYALLALAVAVKEVKENKTDQTPQGKE